MTSRNSAAIATPRREASVAARDILQAGGNAFDAAVASLLTLCVIQPHQVGLGGFGGTLVGYSKTKNRSFAIDFDSRAPLAYTPEAFTNPKDHATGYRSITVPATLAGLEETLKSHGTMTWSQVMASAIHYAENGTVVDPILGQCLQDWNKVVDDESRRALFPDGHIPTTGETFTQKPIAAIFRRIAAEGPEVFYKGDIARTVTRHIQSRGGLLSERDFADYSAATEIPLSIQYRNHAVITPAPPAGGLTTLQILQTLNHFDLSKMKPWSADYFDLVAQATRLCWQERPMILGDPDFVDVPIDEMLSEGRAGERATRIKHRDKPIRTFPPANHPCTANVSIIDSHGNAVSVTATQGVYFGSQTVIPGLALIMNHGMSRFDYAPDNHPNLPAPGKRMQHNMVPTIILKDGTPRFAIGLPGGIRIISVTAQLAIDLIDFHATAKEAVRAPRIDAQVDQHIVVSSNVTDDLMNQLRAIGHAVTRGQIEGPRYEVGGFANAATFDPESGKFDAACQSSDDAALVL